jgi:hypothetical protein
VISAVVGTFWYSNATPMGKAHMRYLGFDKLSPEQQQAKIALAKPNMWKLYVAQMVLSFLTAFAVAFITIMSMQNGLSLGMAMGFVMLNWLCFMVPIIGQGILWSNCDRKLAWQKFISDIFYNLVTVLLIAFVASLFL